MSSYEQTADVSHAQSQKQSQPPQPQDAQYSERSKVGQKVIRRLAQPIRIPLFIAQILAVASSILAVAPYVALVEVGNLLSQAYTTGVMDSASVMQVLKFLIIAYCTRLFLYFLALLITHFADLKLRHILRTRIVERMAVAPLSWFSQASSGSIRKLVQDDTKTVHTVIAHAPIETISAAVQPLALLVYAFYIDWRLGLLSIATIPVYLVLYSLAMRGMPEKTAEMDVHLQDVSSAMVEFVSGIAVVKAFGQVGKSHERYITAADTYCRFFRNWSIPLVTITCLSFIWISIPVLLLVNLGGGALLMTHGYVAISQVLATSLIALVLPAAIQTIASISWSYQLAGGAAMRLDDILHLEQLPEPAPETMQLPRNNVVEFEDVGFSYGKTRALDGVSLTLQPNTVTALMGPSGSGKSTLATLLARFNDPQEGSITIGGVDLRNIPQEELYKHIAFVLQDAQLLHTSIFANITLGMPSASLEEVRACAQAAQIDDYIMSLPKGYDTVIGTDTHLSGGQAQRIAIARALLKNAPILILDEATAMTDPESEADVQMAINNLVKDKTVLVIAHRPGSIMGADQIVILDKGRIVARGTHDELLDEPHYQALLEQAGLTATTSEGGTK